MCSSSSVFHFGLVAKLTLLPCWPQPKQRSSTISCGYCQEQFFRWRRERLSRSPLSHLWERPPGGPVNRHRGLSPAEPSLAWTASAANPKWDPELPIRPGSFFPRRGRRNRYIAEWNAAALQQTPGGSSGIMRTTIRLGFCVGRVAATITTSSDGRHSNRSKRR